jgi:hypothetical protein
VLQVFQHLHFHLRLVQVSHQLFHLLVPAVAVLPVEVVLAEEEAVVEGERAKSKSKVKIVIQNYLSKDSTFGEVFNF